MSEQPHCAFCKQPLVAGDPPWTFRVADGTHDCSVSPTGHHEAAGRF